MEVTLILNYFEHSPQCQLKTMIKVCALNDALMLVAQMKSKGYDITSFHYGIYKGNLYSSYSREREELTDRYPLPVIQRTFREEMQVLWNQVRHVFGS